MTDPNTSHRFPPLLTPDEPEDLEAKYERLLEAEEEKADCQKED